jgi:hypothetical protein
MVFRLAVCQFKDALRGKGKVTLSTFKNGDGLKICTSWFLVQYFEQEEGIEMKIEEVDFQVWSLVAEVAL